MKFPSLFTKTPGHKRFSYAPRFYDPKEEARKEREERIRLEIELEKKEAGGNVSGYRARMTGSFQSARRRSQSSQETLRSNLIRLGVLLTLTLFIIAFLTWGGAAIYGLLLLAPVYLYIKIRNSRSMNKTERQNNPS